MLVEAIDTRKPTEMQRLIDPSYASTDNIYVNYFLPSGTEFSIHVGKYNITLEPEGLTNKTAGLVRIGKIDIDEEIGRLVESKVIG